MRERLSTEMHNAPKTHICFMFDMRQEGSTRSVSRYSGMCC